MLTLFTMPKAFQGHIGTIQRNAIQSWMRLHPDIEILLFGRDEGTAEFAAEFGLRHLPDIECNEHATPLLPDYFRQAQEHARHDLLAYVNADIILLADFMEAVRRIKPPSFLMGGQRFDLDLEIPIDFTDPQWEEKTRADARARGKWHGLTGIDYFVFRRGLLADLPPFALGRFYWDNWLLFHARRRGADLIDATACVMAIHQNHDYRHVVRMSNPGAHDVASGPEAFRNRLLVEGPLFTLKEANLELRPDGALVSRGPSDWKSALNRLALSTETSGMLRPLRPATRWLARQLWDRKWRTRFHALIESGQAEP